MSLVDGELNSVLKVNERIDLKFFYAVQVDLLFSCLSPSLLLFPLPHRYCLRWLRYFYYLHFPLLLPNREFWEPGSHRTDCPRAGSRRAGSRQILRRK